MNSTDQDILYQLLKETDSETMCFSDQDSKCTSYFDNYESQPDLMIYDIENINDVRILLENGISDEILYPIKEHCIKVIVKNIVAFTSNNKEEIHKKNTNIKIPEFIYNF